MAVAFVIETRAQRHQIAVRSRPVPGRGQWLRPFSGREAPPIVKAGYLSLPRGRDIVCRYPLMLCVYSEGASKWPSSCESVLSGVGEFSRLT